MRKMRVCICEKPSLAANVKDGLELMGEAFQYNKDERTYRSQNYVITSALGHLFELFSIEDYKQAAGESIGIGWKLEELPFKPKQWKVKPAKGKEKLIRTIQRYVNSPECTEIIHFGDPDREGEIIVRIILKEIGCKKSVLRPWVKSEEPSDIKEAIESMVCDSEYDSLASAGFARMYMDWYYGMNGSRYMSLRTGETIHFGRVKGAMIRLIYEREEEIKKFVSETTYSVRADITIDDITCTIRSKKVFLVSDKTIAEKMARDYSGWITKVTDVEKKESTVAPPKLFSQTKLQNAVSSLYKISPADTLAACQKLYELKLISYPRTNTEYLAETEKSRVQEIIHVMLNAGFGDIAFRDGKDIFNDSKMAEKSHSAITLTKRIPTPAEIESMSKTEKRVYNTILMRFMATFCKSPHKISKTTVVLEVGDKEAGGEEFVVKGKETLEAGWTIFEKSNQDKEIPSFEVGDAYPVAFVLDKRVSKPPPRYNVETFNNRLLNPLKSSDEVNEEIDYESLRKGLEIGTEATRADTLKEVIAKGYIELVKSCYKITDKGTRFCKNAELLGIDIGVNQTVKFQSLLTQVANGEATTKDALYYTYDFIDVMIANGEDIDLPIFNDKTVGFCPRCKSDVIEREKGFTCANKECKFALWKKNKLLESIKTPLTRAMVENMLEKGYYLTSKCWSDKKQSHYPARLELEDPYDQNNPDTHDSYVKININPKTGRYSRNYQ